LKIDLKLAIHRKNNWEIRYTSVFYYGWDIRTFFFIGVYD